MPRSLVLILSALILLSSGTGCKSKRAKLIPNATIYSSQQYSDYVLDSDYIKNELLRDTSFQAYAADIFDFYERRNFESAWLNGDTLTLSAHDFLNTLSSYESEFGDSSLSAGLDEESIGAMMLSGITEGRTKLDMKLTATFFRYAQQAYGGTSADIKDLEWYIPRRKKDYLRLIDTLVTSPSSYAIYEPVNAYYKALKKVLIEYRAIEKKGRQPMVKATSHPGDSGDDVAQLRSALTMTGDYIGEDTGSYNDRLTAAVARYQKHTGLPMTGVADSITVAEINTPISTRISQLMLNMERLRWMPDSMPAHYILVNIPEYRLHVFDHGADSLSMDVVVGKAASATNIFSGRLSVVGFSPYWNVPQGIILHEMLPKMQKDPGYLAREHMEVLSRGTVVDPSDINWNQYTKGVPFDIRQVPGPDCALGLVAFYFPNTFDIYLHDTPAKSLFSEQSRAFSHGCIRLSQAEKLADYIFRNDTTMTPDHIRELMDAHIEKKFPVHPSIPVFIVYFTAWVDEDGRINFRHDIYGHDARLSREIFGR